MIKSTVITALSSLAMGFIVYYFERALGVSFMRSFLAENGVSILIALLAINSATMGIVLTKIRDLIKNGDGVEKFRVTRGHMLHSIHEQIALVMTSIVLLIIADAEMVKNNPDAVVVFSALTNAVFFYALWILYDTAKGVLIIVDFDSESL